MLNTPAQSDIHSSNHHRDHRKRCAVAVLVFLLLRYCGGSTLWFSWCRSSASCTPAARGAKRCSQQGQKEQPPVQLVKVSTLSADGDWGKKSSLLRTKAWQEMGSAEGSGWGDNWFGKNRVCWKKANKCTLTLSASGQPRGSLG